MDFPAFGNLSSPTSASSFSSAEPGASVRPARASRYAAFCVARRRLAFAATTARITHVAPSVSKSAKMALSSRSWMIVPIGTSM